MNSQHSNQNSSFKKLTLSAIGISAMLALGACSDNTATEEVAETDDVVVVDEPTDEVVVEEPVIDEPVEEPVVEEPALETPVEEAPADDVAVVEEETAEAAPASDEMLQASVEGKALYEKQCVACHQAGLLNAPKLGDKQAWAPRIEKGLETLTLHSAEGFNQMPAQAVNGVSEAQVHAAVEYMVEAAS